MKKFLLMNDESYLVSIIQSVMNKNPKKRLLTCEPLVSSSDHKKLADILKENREVKFFINPLFKSKNKKVVFKDAVFVEKKEEDDGVVEEERRHSVQSVIVRVMKSRKEMMYNDLVKEVEKLMSKFRPTTRLVRN